MNIKTATASINRPTIRRVEGNTSVILLSKPLKALMPSSYILQDTSLEIFLNPYFFPFLMKCLIMPISSQTDWGMAP